MFSINLKINKINLYQIKLIHKDKLKHSINPVSQVMLPLHLEVGIADLILQALINHNNNIKHLIHLQCHLEEVQP